MAPSVKAVSKSAPPVSPKEVTPLELGKLADTAASADKALTAATDALAKAKLELTSAPPAKKAEKQRAVDAAQKKYDAAFEVSGTASAALGKAIGEIAGSKLATKASRLHAMYERTVTARDGAKPGSPARQQLDAAVAVLENRIQNREAAALEKAKWKGVTEAESNMEGLEDLASRSREEQIRLVGAPVVGVSQEKAVAFDRRKVSLAVKGPGTYTAGGAKMLQMQLEGADEATQLKLIAALSDPARDHLGHIIGQSKTDASVAQELANALGSAKGKAKEALLAAIAKGIDGPEHGMLKELGGRARFGQRLELTADLIKELKRSGKTPQAEALMKRTTEGLAQLRKEFEAAKKKVDVHNAEFGRTVTGFAQAVDPKKLEAYRDQFVKQHGADFAAYEAVAARYMEVFKYASTAEGMPNPMTVEGRLVTELSQASVTHADALLSSQSGQKELDRAMELQLLKQPSWLDKVAGGASGVKDKMELPSKVADFAAKAMVRTMASKGAGALQTLVQKNAKLLGIPPDKVDDFAKSLAAVNASGLSQAERLSLLKKTTGEISAGEYGGKSVKALGLLLAAPGLINGWIDIKDKTAFEVVGHTIDTLGFGNELVNLFTDTKVLGKVLGVAGVGMSLIKGIGALSEGKLFEGGMGMASAVGGALMMVPGGQLFGAALVLGSAIASHLWGEDPAQDAEDKQEAAVKDFLVQAGVPEPIANELKDVLQTNHRSMGPFIEQMATYLKMKPSEFLAFLSGKKPSEVRELVQMVKNMPTDKSWNFATKKGDRRDQPTRESAFQDELYIGPRSLETAKAWMAKRGLVPPQAQ